MIRTAFTAVALLATTGCSTDVFDDIFTPRLTEVRSDNPTPARTKAMLRVANASAAAGDMGTAVALYRKAHAADPRNPEILVKLGAALLRIGENDQALSVYRKATLIGGTVEAHVGMAKSLIALDKPEAAIVQLSDALKQEESSRIYNAMGVAHDLIGDHGAAQAYYRTGLDVEPGDPGILNNLGLSLSVSGKHDEAIRVLRRSASSPRATARNRLNLALAYGMAGEMTAAAETARIDLDESAVQRNLSFYATLRALDDSRQTIRAIGAHNATQAVRPAPRG